MNNIENDVLGMMYQEKWEKTQILIRELRKMLESGEKISTPKLESIQGFLICLAGTF